MATERILIVDDEETLCEVLQLNLENEGYDVDIAFSAEAFQFPRIVVPVARSHLPALL